MGLVAKGYQVLRDEGVVSFTRKGIRYISSQLHWFGRNTYWSLQYSFVDRKYDLSIADVTITFSADSRTAFQRNKGRFVSERETIADLLQNLNEDDVFYDIGANTGLYTLFAARECSDVVAFEPYPPNVTALRQNLFQNDISNVKVYDIALSDSNGQFSFRVPEEDVIGYGSSSMVTDETENILEVPTRTGDDTISDDELANPNVLKIDVEGSEPLVIEGLEQALSSAACRLVYCEVHLGNVDYRPSIHDFGYSLEDVKSQLQNCGFTVNELDSRGGVVFLKGHK